MDTDRLGDVELALINAGQNIADGVKHANQWGDLDTDDAPERVLWDFGITVDPDEVGHGAMLVEYGTAQHLFGVFYGAATRRSQ